MADPRYRFFDYDPHEEALRDSDERQAARDAMDHDYDDGEDFDDETEN